MQDELHFSLIKRTKTNLFRLDPALPKCRGLLQDFAGLSSRQKREELSKLAKEAGITWVLDAHSEPADGIRGLRDSALISTLVVFHELLCDTRLSSLARSSSFFLKSCCRLQPAGAILLDSSEGMEIFRRTDAQAVRRLRWSRMVVCSMARHALNRLSPEEILHFSLGDSSVSAKRLESEFAEMTWLLLAEDLVWLAPKLATERRAAQFRLIPEMLAAATNVGTPADWSSLA